MNENVDLTKILKNCPKGTKFYSTIFGEVEFECISGNIFYPIRFRPKNESIEGVTSKGYYKTEYDGECTLFPSKDQRDWSKFSAPWYKKERFDPNTLQPFDKVLVRDVDSAYWRCAFYSHKRKKEESTTFRYATTANSYICCIPYNDDTKHLVGTTEEPPEYYRYWED